MKVGIIGGTFDPMHIGHLAIAEDVWQELGLDHVLFIPAGQPWLKEGRTISERHHRLNMVKIGVGSKPHFKVSSVEIDRAGPTYTVDTLRTLQKQGVLRGDCYFIIGEDSYANFFRWKEPAHILELCTLVVVGRPGHLPHGNGVDHINGVSLADKIMFHDGPLVDISGTAIRHRVIQGYSIQHLVPREVVQYIESNDLYRKPEGANE